MLPITRVVMFKHGVGYFQRTGKVEGNELIELSFKASQMNDVLKSLTVLDHGGGTFAALSYDSEEPIERRLAELNIQIPAKGAFSTFLDRLKGAKVAVPRGTDKLSGIIVGIEEVKRSIDNATVTEPHLVVLADEGRLVRVPLLEVDELSFLDDNVQKDLKTLLDILFSSLRKDRKRLSIQALGANERQVSLSYVVEAPVWKTSYRLVLPAANDDKALLQGWALVDNTTEDDWEGVTLSLVSGLPISFVHDLYTPRYRRRPVVELEEEAAVAPRVAVAAEAAGGEDFGEAARLSDVMSDGEIVTLSEELLGPSARLRESIDVHTKTQEVGDLFTYEITQPVDVGRGRSALVPILQASADAERVVLYNPAVREKNPMTAFRLKNRTGLTLEGGPVTVFEGDAYVGEAMLDTMRKDDERITPYSVELAVTVKHESHQKREAFTRVKKRGQYIHKYYRSLLVTEYEFVSGLDDTLVAYLDHRFTYAARENTPEPSEVTDNFWRFKLELPGRQTTSFSVTEVAEQYESIEIPKIAREEIYDLVKKNLIRKEVQSVLEKIADQAEKITALDADRVKFEQRGDEIVADQKRLRENLKSLGTTSEEAKLRQKYVSKLASGEEEIESLRKEVTRLIDAMRNERIATAKIVLELEMA